MKLDIKADTISFAWYLLLKNIDRALETPINFGSYAKDDYRLQFESVAVEIEKPYYDMIPIMPVGMEAIAPTDMSYVENYFSNYLMSPLVAENETYTYGSRIAVSIDHVIGMLKDNPFNNQMVIEIARPLDIRKSDPPCLRLIDFKVVRGSAGLRLNMHLYFRSWELWAGFPTNLAGLEMLRQYVAISAGIPEERGKIFAYSSGLHVYGANIDNVCAFLKKEIV